MRSKMNNTQLREKYREFFKSEVYTYPSHFFSPKDDFTLNIQNWLTYLGKYENQTDLLFFGSWYMPRKIGRCGWEIVDMV
jgi:hypothetical protein